MNLHLHVDGYVALPTPIRREFDDWLRAEDIARERIVESTFGEGFLDAVCISDPPRWNDEHTGPVTERRMLLVRTPPPAALLQLLAAA